MMGDGYSAELLCSALCEFIHLNDCGLVFGQSFARQFGQASFNFVPDTSDRDAEDALAALEQVDDLIG